MTTLISPDGREYRTSNVLEMKRLINGHRYVIKGEDKGSAVFHPGDHTVVEVVAYIKDHPDDADRVLDEERTGEARKTLIGEED